MTTTLRQCCEREPLRTQWIGDPRGFRIRCSDFDKNCPASTAWHATAEGAEAEWNGRVKQND